MMPLSLSKKRLNDFMDMVDKEEEKRVKKAFLSFLKNDQTDTFHSPSTIRKLLDDPSQPHSFDFFLNRVNKLMRAWASQVFESPTIADMNLSSARKSKSEVAIKAECGQARALKKLQRSRARLNDHVEDPLYDAISAATIAKRNRKRKKQDRSPSEEKVENDEESEEDISAGDRAFTGRTKIIKKKHNQMSPKARKTMLDKKKSAMRLNFTPERESDSEHIEDPSQEDEVLSDVKKRAKVTSPSPIKKRKSQQKMYEGKRIWTDVEKSAVIEGAGRLGVGKWAEIKREYYVALNFRTSGQIKDCFRTLKKRAEIKREYYVALNF